MDNIETNADDDAGISSLTLYVHYTQYRHQQTPCDTI